MARFDSINDMPTEATYAAWRFDRQPGFKVTPDFATPQECAQSLIAYAKREGISAQNVEFFIIKETVNWRPMTKTVFTIVTTTTQV